MRGFLAFLFLGLVALGAGVMGYNIGVSQAVTTTAAAGGATVVYAGPHVAGWWFFPFGFLLFPLFLLAFFGFLGFVFGPRRRFGRGGWAGRDSYGPAGFGPMGGRWDARREWVAEQHRRLHEEEARTAPTSGPADAPPSTSDGPAAG
jgi:hypothetical protein